MESQIVSIDASDWRSVQGRPEWVAALEAGKVLFFPHLKFALQPGESSLLRPDIRDERSRNISLDATGRLKGAAGDAPTQALLTQAIARFREDANALIAGLLPGYLPHLRMAPTSYRPAKVETRAQSWRADDRRLHVDAFPSRPNYGERILRVFTNLNPEGKPRVWRVGEPFEKVASTFLPRAKAYSRWQAKALHMLHVTKSFRSEYDHLMLQLHDGMKGDLQYQSRCEQEPVEFPAGSSWVCFSDQASHAVMSGQYMMEQTLHLAPGQEYDPASSPLSILTRIVGRPLQGVSYGAAQQL